MLGAQENTHYQQQEQQAVTSADSNGRLLGLLSHQYRPLVTMAQVSYTTQSMTSTVSYNRQLQPADVANMRPSPRSSSAIRSNTDADLTSHHADGLRQAGELRDVYVRGPQRRRFTNTFHILT